MRSGAAASPQAIGDGVAVIPTAPERVRNRDTHYPYRFDSHFYYLTGFAEPEAVLVLLQDKSILFCREKNPERETWDGFRYGPEAARERFGFDEAHPIAALDREMERLLENQRGAPLPDGRRRGMGRARHALAECGARSRARRHRRAGARAGCARAGR